MFNWLLRFYRNDNINYRTLRNASSADNTYTLASSNYVRSVINLKKDSLKLDDGMINSTYLVGWIFEKN